MPSSCGPSYEDQTVARLAEQRAFAVLMCREGLLRKQSVGIQICRHEPFVARPMQFPFKQPLHIAHDS